MFWLQRPPYGRWALALLIAAGALWVEFRPDPSVEAPYAVVDIAPGDLVTADNTEMRRVPEDLVPAAELDQLAVRSIPAGDPVLARDVASTVLPPGWWVVSVALPPTAEVGEEVRLVLLDTGDTVPGVVAHAGVDDPFAAADGGVAVPPEHAASVAMATASGRLAVLVSSR